MHVMNSALSLHGTCLRMVMRKHHGYESCTEGDSFIVVFPDVHCGLQFALDSQEELLKLDWPRELLKDKLCAKV